MIFFKQTYARRRVCLSSYLSFRISKSPIAQKAVSSPENQSIQKKDLLLNLPQTNFNSRFHASASEVAYQPAISS